jgi:hypothetical protein
MPQARHLELASLARRHPAAHPEVLVTISERGPKIEDVRAAIALLAG